MKEKEVKTMADNMKFQEISLLADNVFNNLEKLFTKSNEKISQLNFSMNAKLNLSQALENKSFSNDSGFGNLKNSEHDSFVYMLEQFAETINKFINNLEKKALNIKLLDKENIGNNKLLQDNIIDSNATSNDSSFAINPKAFEKVKDEILSILQIFENFSFGIREFQANKNSSTASYHNEFDKNDYEQRIIESLKNPKFDFQTSSHLDERSQSHSNQKTVNTLNVSALNIYTQAQDIDNIAKNAIDALQQEFNTNLVLAANTGVRVKG